MNFTDRFVFSEDAKLYQILHVFVSLLCIASSYLYFYMASFKEMHTNFELMFFISICIESVFLFYSILQFFKAYVSESSIKRQERDLSKIAMNYLKTEFIWDCIPLIPLQGLTFPRHRERWFYLIKTIRLEKGFRLFDVAKFMKIIKGSMMEQLTTSIEKDPEWASSKKTDFNMSEKLLYISYVLRLFELILIILNTSYICGLSWYIMCEMHEDLWLDVSYRDMADGDLEEFSASYFIPAYGLQDNTPARNVIVLFYFAFTTLSTVGFGDFHPKGNLERLVCSFVFLFGVSLFSYVMGYFIEVLQSLQ